MSGTSRRIQLEPFVIDGRVRANLRYGGAPGLRVSGIEGAVGPFASEEEWTRAVNHSLAFHNEVLCVYDLGEGIPLVVVAKGSHPIGNGVCGSHTNFEPTCPACQKRRCGDPDEIEYNVDNHGFKTLGEALVMALAVRDRGNINDASWTAGVIQRVLKG